MNKIKLDKFKFVTNKEDYIYILEVNNNKYTLKRIKENSELIIIKYEDEIISFDSIIYNEKVKKINTLNIEEKDYIINDIFNTLNKNIINNFIDYNELLSKVKKTYINNIICNDNIGLTISDNNIIYVVLLSNNSIIGKIKMDYDIKVNVSYEYLKDTLILLTEYINLRNNNYSKKLLKNNYV